MGPQVTAKVLLPALYRKCTEDRLLTAGAGLAPVSLSYPLQGISVKLQITNLIQVEIKFPQREVPFLYSTTLYSITQVQSRSLSCQYNKMEQSGPS